MKSKIYKYNSFLFITIFLGLFISSCNSNEEKLLPLKRDLVESVYSSIIVQPDSLYSVYSAVSGLLEKNLVEEGDVVQKNQSLVQITNTTPILNSKNAKLTYDLAKENYLGSAAILEGIRDEIEAAKLKFKNDSINYFRQKRLWDKNIGSNIEFDTRKLNYQLSKNSLQLLQSKYIRTKKELFTAVKQAENNYKSSLVNTTDFTVKSAINGKVYQLTKNVGEIVTNLEPVAIIGSESLFIIEMLVDEVDIVKIKESQQVIIVLDAYKGEVFSGIVSKIYPKKDERNQTFKVEALFKKKPNVLYPGLSGEANIVIASRKNVLSIPKIYLTNNGQVKTENGLVNVETGIQNLEFVEITSGISENTAIYKPD